MRGEGVVAILVKYLKFRWVNKNLKKMKPLAKVVVVEDDNDLLFLYRHKLEREGFTVVCAKNGAEGLQIAEEHLPDIILLDLLMPVMSGPEMLARLRSTEWGSGIRVIVLTNISKDEAPPALRLLNVDRYVVKAHHTPAQVVGIVHEILGLKPANRNG